MPAVPMKFVRRCFLAGALASAVGIALAQPSAWLLRHQRAGGFLWSIASDGERRLVAVGTGGRVLVSDDGVIWNSRASGVTDWLVAVAFGYQRFIAVGERGRILISPTGDVWTAVAGVPTTARLNNVFFGSSGEPGSRVRVVAVGESGTALVSEDLGATWRAGATGGTGWLRGLTYFNTRSYWYAPLGGGTSGLSSQRSVYEYAFVACGQAGRVIASVDGITWTPMNAGTREDLEAVSYHPTFAYSALALGSNGVVRTFTAPRASFSGDRFAGYTGPAPALPPYPDWEPGSLGPTGDVRLRGLTRDVPHYPDYRSILLASGEQGVIVLDGVIQPTGLTQNLVAGVYHNARFYVVGEDETVLQQAEPVYYSKLSNLSTRGVAGVTRGVLVGGLVIRGFGPKRVLVRAVGPGLEGFGITGFMPRPLLTAFDATGTKFASNTGWANDPALANTAAEAGAFPLQPGSNDAALSVTLAPGNYTFFIEPAVGSAGGTALFEAYDAEPASNTAPRLLNVSTAGFVGRDSEALIAGFTISGESNRTVLIRGIGPSLRKFGVEDAVTDCALTVYRGKLVQAANDDWGSSPNATQLSFAFAQAGAFSLEEDSRDAALICPNLLRGSYTVVLAAKAGAAGRGMIEIYELP